MPAEPFYHSLPLPTDESGVPDEPCPYCGSCEFKVRAGLAYCAAGWVEPLYRVFTLTWPSQPGRPAGRGTMTSPEPITVEEAQDSAAERIPGAEVEAVETRAQVFHVQMREAEGIAEALGVTLENMRQELRPRWGSLDA